MPYARLLVMVVLTAAAAAADLSPGARFEIPLPELGDTNDGGKARVGIQLPDNYDRERRFPGIVYFGGGSGDADPSKMHRIIGGRDFVVIALPYRKGRNWGSPLSWYQPMLDAAFEAVPNLERRVLVTSGFSSGGGACGVVTFTEGGMELFCATIPAGLAPDFAEVNHPRFEGFPILAIIGEQDTAHSRLAQMRTFRDQCERSDVDLTYLEMPGVGHNWDESSWPQVREFLQTKVRDPQRARMLAGLEAAASKERWAAVLELAPSVLGLCDADHADAARARELLAAADAAAQTEAAELVDSDRARDLQRFLAEFGGSRAAAPIQARYDALAAQERPEALAAGADERALKKWLRDVEDFVGDWPGSAAAAELESAMDAELTRRLVVILAQPDGRDRLKALVGFAKTHRDHPVGHRALAIAKEEAGQ